MQLIYVLLFFVIAFCNFSYKIYVICMFYTYVAYVVNKVFSAVEQVYTFLICNLFYCRYNFVLIYLLLLLQAYHRPQSSAVQVAKIIAVTVVLVAVVLGGFILASAYVQANASCRQLEQELELLSEAADRFQPPLQPEALVQVRDFSTRM